MNSPFTNGKIWHGVFIYEENAQLCFEILRKVLWKSELKLEV